MLYVIIPAALLLLAGMFAAWLLRRRGGSGLVGFREYVRNPALRERLSGILERRDATTAALAKLPPDQLVEELLDSATDSMTSPGEPPPGNAALAGSPPHAFRLHVLIFSGKYSGHIPIAAVNSITTPTTAAITPVISAFVT